MQPAVADYGAGHDPAAPLISPIFADRAGLPPLVIQAGSHEVLLDEGTAALDRAGQLLLPRLTASEPLV